MYLDYYELTTYPFRTNPDPGFLWFGEKHKEALSLLKYGILKRDGFLLLTGDVGTGKTSLIRYLLKLMDWNNSKAQKTGTRSVIYPMRLINRVLKNRA
jgi:general secretion pathway protein A